MRVYIRTKKRDFLNRANNKQNDILMRQRKRSRLNPHTATDQENDNLDPDSDDEPSGPKVLVKTWRSREINELMEALDRRQNQNESEELAACRSELEKAKEEIEKARASYDKEKDRLEKLNKEMTDELQEKELENDRQYQTIVDLK
ncbi:predicted protein, partial [Nematostella vectensis]